MSVSIMPLQPWRRRPSDEAALFNPSFCGELLARAVVGFGDEAAGRALPLVLAAMILPLTLHRATRDALPSRASTSLSGWTAEHSSLLLPLPERARAFRPPMQEALIFMGQLDALAVGGLGVALGGHPPVLSRQPDFTTAETEACRRAASLCGRWFGRQPSTSGILQAFGLRP